MDGKGIDSSNAVDHEFPPHKNAKSFCGMAVHMLDLDTMAWSTVTCKNSGTGAEPSHAHTTRPPSSVRIYLLLAGRSITAYLRTGR